MPGSPLEGIVKLAAEFSGTWEAAPRSLPAGAGVVVVVVPSPVPEPWGTAVVVGGAVDSVSSLLLVGLGASLLSLPISAAAPPSIKTPAAAPAATPAPTTTERRSIRSRP